MSETSLAIYRALTASDERTAFRQTMETKGYRAFFTFVDDFRNLLKRYAEPESEEVGELIRQARADFPNPQQFSPSWDNLWEVFEAIYAAKNETLADVPAPERDGDWQVLIDNPYLPHHVVCYPGLAFVDAAYTYAYFQQELKPNEVLMLQKVSHVHIKNGRKEASMLPDT